MSRKLIATLAFLLLLAGVLWIVNSDKPTTRVLFYCAASNRAVMEEIRAEYEKETGRRVEIQYGPSQTLLSQIEVSKRGDLYLPADISYLDIGREKDLITERLDIARMEAVLVVPKGNPQQIGALSDLWENDLRVVQANPDAAAIGKVTRRVLTEASLWGKLDAATNAYRSTVTDVANDVLVGAADVGIVYDAVLHTYPDLEYVEIPELAPAASQIAISVLEVTEQSDAAFHFARYIAARDRGLKKYEQHGFRIGEGDAWADLPKISIFAGSMLRPAIEETIIEFEKREGIQIERAFNGCGILVGQMKAGQLPDAYFACDQEFMNQVVDLFPEPIDVSENELVILVKKGNPKEIWSLKDLTRDGLKVGIGHEKLCAMGWITQNTFRESGIQQEVMSNVLVQAPTGDLLVNQLRTGSLDAAVVYLSNAAGSSDLLDAVQIQGLPCSVAIQPWAVAKESKFPQLTSRLFARICSAESQGTFAAEGFRWRYGKESEQEQNEASKP